MDSVTFTYYITDLDTIDRQIEELQRRKEAIQKGYCYVPGMTIFNSIHGTLADLEETESR